MFDLQQYVINDDRFKKIIEQVDEKDREAFMNAVNEFITKLGSISAAINNDIINVSSKVKNDGN